MWNLRSEDRLAEWKEFRSIISRLSFDEAVQKTVHYWSYAPFVNHYLDRQSPQDWPSPWELVIDGKYDDMAKALGMLYTLVLSEHGKEHTFSIIRAQEASSLASYNLVSIDDGKYVLNYIFNEVISTEKLRKELQINQVYTSADLQLEKY